MFAGVRTTRSLLVGLTAMALGPGAAAALAQEDAKKADAKNVPQIDWVTSYPEALKKSGHWRDEDPQ